MEQKVVKFEIGKLLAVIITITVIALVAGLVLQSNYFQGALKIDTNKEVMDTNPLPAKEMDYFSRIEMFKINIEKGLDYGKELDNLKYDFDLMIKEKYIDAEVAKETIKAFSTMETSVIIDFVDKYISAYQDKVSLLDKDSLPAYQDLVADFVKVSIPVYQDKAVLIEKIDILATANVVDYAVVTDMKESFIESGVASIETIKFDIDLIETVNTYDSISFDAALKSLNKEIETGIELSIAFDTFDSALDTIKQDVAIEVTKGLPEAIASIEKGIDSQLDSWIETIDTLTIDSVAIDQGVLAKYLEAGKGFDVLAKSFDIFNANIDKGMDIDVAIEMLAKDIDVAMPGLMIIK